MKVHARLHRGSKTLEHEVELVANETVDGVRRFRIGNQAAEAHSEEITPGVYSLLLHGKSYEAFVSKRPGDAPGLGGPYVIVVGLRRYLVELHDPRRWRRTGSSLEAEGPQEIVAPMPGKIVKVLVVEGQEVARNQGLLMIEAMKMQNELRAPRAGRIERVYMEEGRGVESGARLLRLGRGRG
jgi:biotin carboxyl carrier protein